MTAPLASDPVSKTRTVPEPRAPQTRQPAISSPRCLSSRTGRSSLDPHPVQWPAFALPMRPAPGAQLGFVRRNVHAVLDDRFLILVGEGGSFAEDEPGALAAGLARAQPDDATLGCRRAEDVDSTAALARTDLEDRRVAVGAVSCAGELDVWALIREAGEGALSGSQEEVVAGRQRRWCRPGLEPRWRARNHGRQSRTRIRILAKDRAGDIVERLSARQPEYLPQRRQGLLVREPAAAVAVEPTAACDTSSDVSRAATACSRCERPQKGPAGASTRVAKIRSCREGSSCDPLEGLAEQVRRELGDCTGIRPPTVAEVAMHWMTAFRCDPVADPAQQHRDLGALAAVVHVRLVDDDEPPFRVLAGREQVHVERAQQQVLEHGVVGQQQVRRRPLASPAGSAARWAASAHRC